MRTVSHALSEPVGVVALVLRRRPDRHPARVPAPVGAHHLTPPMAAGRRDDRPAVLLGEPQRLLDVLLRVARTGRHAAPGSRLGRRSPEPVDEALDGIDRHPHGPPDVHRLEQITSAGVVTYYHHDQIGSTRALTNSTGSVVATYTYDPYGKLSGITGSATNPFGFAGQYTDPESGLIYMRARYYEPSTGVFLTRDPIEAQTREPYGYVGGNPLNVTDPLGLCWGPGCWVRDHWRGVSQGLAIAAVGVAVLAVPAAGIGLMAVADGAVAGAGWFGVSTALGFASSGISALQMTVVCSNGSSSACDWSMTTFVAGVGTNAIGKLLPGTGALLGVGAAVAGLTNPNLNDCPSESLPGVDPAGVTRDPRLVGS
jgi:RHS repeat-associated protein